MKSSLLTQLLIITVILRACPGGLPMESYILASIDVHGLPRCVPGTSTWCRRRCPWCGSWPPVDLMNWPRLTGRHASLDVSQCRWLSQAYISSTDGDNLLDVVSQRTPLSRPSTTESTLKTVNWRHSNLWSLCRGATRCIGCEDLSHYLKKTESVGLRKCLYYHYILLRNWRHIVTITNISQSLLHIMAWRKTAGIDMVWRNYVTVILCTLRTTISCRNLLSNFSTILQFPMAFSNTFWEPKQKRTSSTKYKPKHWLM